MAIVNLTEDSYFPESRCSGVEAALLRISRMIDEVPTSSTSAHAPPAPALFR